MSLTPIADLLASVARRYAMTAEEIRAHDAEPRVVEARHVAMYLAHFHLGKSKAEVARRFGRDHSTVCHAIRKVRANPELMSIAANIAVQA